MHAALDAGITFFDVAPCYGLNAAGRRPDPEDFAGAAAFLAPRASDYVHGAIVPIDGGWLGR